MDLMLFLEAPCSRRKRSCLQQDRNPRWPGPARDPLHLEAQRAGIGGFPWQRWPERRWKSGQAAAKRSKELWRSPNSCANMRSWAHSRSIEDHRSQEWCQIAMSWCCCLPLLVSAGPRQLCSSGGCWATCRSRTLVSSHRSQPGAQSHSLVSMSRWSQPSYFPTRYQEPPHLPAKTSKDSHSLQPWPEAA